MILSPLQSKSGRSYWFWMRPPASHLSRIVQEVAERHGLSVEDLTGPSKVRRIAHARQEAMWELRQRTRLSFLQIAQRLGRSDHTTARHGEKAHKRRLAERMAAE